MSVGVRIYQPRPALQPYVTFFHMVEVTEPLTDFLYPEWGNIRFTLDGAWDVRVPRVPCPTPQHGGLFGPTDRHSLVQTTGGRTFGFGLTPLGWHRIARIPANRLANRAQPLGDTLGMSGEALHGMLAAASDDAAAVAIAEATVIDRLATAPPIAPAIHAVDAALRTHPATVEAFAAHVGVGGDRLRRMCLAAFGFPTKRVLRLQRFLRVLGHVRTAVGDPIEPSLDQQYFDQSHFYRDFRDFMAMSPRQYFSAPRLLMAEAAAAQVRSGITLSFDLPPGIGTDP